MRRASWTFTSGERVTICPDRAVLSSPLEKKIEQSCFELPSMPFLAVAASPWLLTNLI
jgi:hypothetical protein